MSVRYTKELCLYHIFSLSEYIFAHYRAHSCYFDTHVNDYVLKMCRILRISVLYDNVIQSESTLGERSPQVVRFIERKIKQEKFSNKMLSSSLLLSSSSRWWYYNIIMIVCVYAHYMHACKYCCSFHFSRENETVQSCAIWYASVAVKVNFKPEKVRVRLLSTRCVKK